MVFHVLTLFPKSLDSYLKTSIIGRAIKAKKIYVKKYNLRDFGVGKLKKTEGRPYGGGPGLVEYALPILKSIEHIKLKIKSKNFKIIIFSPAGKKFTNELARKWSKKNKELILISGRYEGIDARVKKILRAEEISIGDYILTGGELPSLVVIDAVARQIPGVLGKVESIEENRISSSEVYTRPETLIWKGKKYKVPKVLLTGHHGNIEKWKKNKLTQD